MFENEEEFEESYATVYWKVIVYDDSESGNEYVGLACMQWHDESDYIQSKFIKDENGKQYKFYNEEEGAEWLNKNIKYNSIEPQYRRHDSNNRREDFWL